MNDITITMNGVSIKVISKTGNSHESRKYEDICSIYFGTSYAILRGYEGKFIVSYPSSSIVRIVGVKENA